MTEEEQIDMFIAEVEEIRKKKKLTIYGLSELAFDTKFTYQSIKSKKSVPSFNALSKIAKALDRHLIICLSEEETK